MEACTVLVDFPTHINTIKMELSILYFRGHRVKFSNYDVTQSLKIEFVLANHVDLHV